MVYTDIVFVCLVVNGFTSPVRNAFYKMYKNRHRHAIKLYKKMHILVTKINDNNKAHIYLIQF